MCLTVTLMDGLVLARSAFHTSINYRSVVVLGKARLVTDLIEKWQALRSFTNHVIAGRWEQAKQPNEQELKATSVLSLPLEKSRRKFAPGRPSTTKKTTRCRFGEAWFRWFNPSANLSYAYGYRPESPFRVRRALPQGINTRRSRRRAGYQIFNGGTGAAQRVHHDSFGKLSRNPLSIQPSASGTSRESEMASHRAYTPPSAASKRQ